MTVKTNIEINPNKNVYLTQNELIGALDASNDRFFDWKRISISQRRIFVQKLITTIAEHKDILASNTHDMGKPMSQAIAEVEKTIKMSLLCASNHSV